MVLCELEKKYKISYPEAFRKVYETGALLWLNHDSKWVKQHTRELRQRHGRFFENSWLVFIPFNEVAKAQSNFYARLEADSDYEIGAVVLNPDYKFIPFAKLDFLSSDVYMFIYDSRKPCTEPSVAIYHHKENVMYLCAPCFADFVLDLLKRNRDQIFAEVFSRFVPDLPQLEAELPQTYFHHLVPVEASDSETIYDTLNLPKQLVIKGKSSDLTVEIDEIRYIEADNKSCIIHLGSTSVHCSKTLGYIEALLPETSFFRCHKSFIIGFKNVVKVSGYEVLFDNGSKAEVSKKKIVELKNHYNKFKGAKK